MPPTLRSLKYRDSASSDAFVSEANALNSLPTAEIKDLKVKVEAQRPAKVTKKRKTHKRIKYQKAPFALRAKLVEMVNNEGYSIRQAAKKLSLKYSTAKCIHKLFLEENRLGTTRVSKSAILGSESEKNTPAEDDLETRSEQRRTLTAGIKKIKRNPEVLAENKKVFDEEELALKQEYDDGLETQVHESQTSYSSNYRKNSLQSEMTRSDVMDSNLLMSQIQRMSSVSEATKPEIISYVPQIYQGCLVLIPVKIPANPETRMFGMGYRSSLLNAAQQLQAMSQASPNPSFYSLNQLNNSNTGCIGYNFAKQLRDIGVNMP